MPRSARDEPKSRPEGLAWSTRRGTERPGIVGVHRALFAGPSFLENNPEIGREYEARNVRLAGVRVWRVSGFEKHLIFYRPNPEGVEILDVIHGARDIEALVFSLLREEIREGLDSGPAERLDMEAVKADARKRLSKNK